LRKARRYCKRLRHLRSQNIRFERLTTRRPSIVGSNKDQRVTLSFNWPRDSTDHQNALDEKEFRRSKSKVLRRLQNGNKMFFYSKVINIQKSRKKYMRKK